MDQLTRGTNATIQLVAGAQLKPEQSPLRAGPTEEQIACGWESNLKPKALENNTRYYKNKPKIGLNSNFPCDQ